MRLKILLIFILMICQLFYSFGYSSALEEKNNDIYFMNGSPWPLYRGNPQNTGLSRYDSMNNTGSLKWIHQLNGIYNTRIPVIGPDGTIFIAAQNDSLYAINPNGTLKWKSITNGDIGKSPIIDNNGTIYVYSSNPNHSLLYAFFMNGSIKWTFNVSKIDPLPTIEPNNDILISQVAGEIGEKRKLVSIFPNGSIDWELVFDDYFPELAINTNGTIYIWEYNGNFSSINPNGTINWIKTITPYKIKSFISIDKNDDIYFVTNEGTINNYFPNGTSKWIFNLKNETMYLSNISDLAISSNGMIYVCVNQSLYSINSQGILNWKFQVDEKITSSPTLSNDGIIYFGSNNFLYAIFPNGSLKWKFHALCQIHTAPSIDYYGNIYFSTYCIDDSSNYYLYALGNIKSPPSSPIDLKAISGNGYVYLDWATPSYLSDYGMNIYKIYKGTNSGSEKLLATISANNRFYLDKDVTNSHNYFYYVTAGNINGESMPSNEVQAFPDSRKIDIEKPTIEIESPINNSILKNNKILIRGMASDNIAVIEVKISIDEINWIAVNGTTQWSYNLNLTSGKNQIFVKAIDPSGNEGNANVNIEYKKNVNRIILSARNIGIIIFIIIFSIILAMIVYIYRKREKREFIPGSPKTSDALQSIHVGSSKPKGCIPGF